MAESRSVSITRIFAGDDGQSHFEGLSVPLEEFFGHPAPTIAGRSIGFMAALPATEMSFRVHPARRRSSFPLLTRSFAPGHGARGLGAGGGRRLHPSVRPR